MKLDLGEPVDFTGGGLLPSLLPGLWDSLRYSLGRSLWDSLMGGLLDSLWPGLWGSLGRSLLDSLEEDS